MSFRQAKIPPNLPLEKGGVQRVGANAYRSHFPLWKRGIEGDFPSALWRREIEGDSRC